MNCRSCGKIAHLLAGIVVFPNDRRLHKHSFHTCWTCGLVKRHTRDGAEDWQSIRVKRSGKPQWVKHTEHHWSMVVHGEQLHFWPTARKVSWRGVVRSGFNEAEAARLAEAIQQRGDQAA